MSKEVIKVEELGKLYRLGEVGTGTLSHDLSRWWASVRGKPDPYARLGTTNDRSTKASRNEVVWALKDINFSIEQGEVVGIIGRNGAGKSTLLKIISRITAPSTGAIRIRGRVASLLEVGTGFHPEMTGTENVYMNGTLLGMTRAEIKRKMSDIVDFAGVAKYVDTPVKRYSSGMQVRLAFAVAAFLEPEILIVDEVLAVGDAEFQRRAIGRMQEVSRTEGRTVLFVSHNMQAIAALCSHGIFMKKGMANPKTTAAEAINDYVHDFESSTDIQFPVVKSPVIIHHFALRQNGVSKFDYSGDAKIDVSIDFEVEEDLSNFRIGFFIRNGFGELLNRSLLADWDMSKTLISKGRYRLSGHIPPYWLVAGNYTVQVHSSRYGIVDYGLEDLTSIPITLYAPTDFNQAYTGEKIFGSMLIKQNWNLERV